MFRIVITKPLSGDKPIAVNCCSRQQKGRESADDPTSETYKAEQPEQRMRATNLRRMGFAPYQCRRSCYHRQELALQCKRER